MPVKDNAGGAFEAGAIGLHGRDEHHTLEPRAGTGQRMGKVRAAVLVPEGAGVDEPSRTDHPDGRLPSARRILRPDHEDAAVRVTYIYIIPAVVVTDGGCPHAVSVLDGGMEGLVVVHERGAHFLPVHEVCRVQDGKAREAVEGGGRHVEVLPYAAYVGVRVVQVKNGIGVGYRQGRFGSLAGGGEHTCSQ